MSIPKVPLWLEVTTWVAGLSAIGLVVRGTIPVSGHIRTAIGILVLGFMFYYGINITIDMVRKVRDAFKPWEDTYEEDKYGE